MSDQDARLNEQKHAQPDQFEWIAGKLSGAMSRWSKFWLGNPEIYRDPDPRRWYINVGKTIVALNPDSKLTVDPDWLKEQRRDRGKTPVVLAPKIDDDGKATLIANSITRVETIDQLLLECGVVDIPGSEVDRIVSHYNSRERNSARKIEDDYAEVKGIRVYVPKDAHFGYQESSRRFGLNPCVLWIPGIKEDSSVFLEGTIRELKALHEFKPDYTMSLEAYSHLNADEQRAEAIKLIQANYAHCMANSLADAKIVNDFCLELRYSIVFAPDELPDAAGYYSSATSERVHRISQDRQQKLTVFSHVVQLAEEGRAWPLYPVSFATTFGELDRQLLAVAKIIENGPPVQTPRGRRV